jgi:hypothetical protein
MRVVLIGIDEYPAGGRWKTLAGCVNDINAVQRVLVSRLGVDPGQIVRLTSPAADPSKLATWANIVNALKALGVAGDARDEQDPRVFIYYSGHGFSVNVAVDGVNVACREGLVPVDYRDAPGAVSSYLYDFQINSLLRGITARTEQVTLILDSCHSAGATRGVLEDGHTLRGGAIETPVSAADLALALDLGDGLRAESQATGGIGARSAADDDLVEASGRAASVGACQIVAACLADEGAAEFADSKTRTQHGLLTRKLVALLDAVDEKEDLAELTWGRIWRSLVAEMGLSGAQHATLTGSYARRVFGGPLAEGDTGHGVTLLNDTYTLDAGTLVGLTVGAKVAVYGDKPASFPPLGSPDDKPAGLLRVNTATRSSATAVPDPAGAPRFDLPPGARARLVERSEAARLIVGLSENDEGLAAQIKASPMLRLVEAGERAAVQLEKCENGAWALTDSVSGQHETENQQVLVQIPQGSLDRARAVLEHYVRYSEPLRMAELCTNLPGALAMTLLYVGDKSVLLKPGFDPAAPALPGVLPTKGGNLACTQGDKFAISVRNKSDVTLRVWLFDCNSEGQVESLGNAMIGPNKLGVFWHPIKSFPFPLNTRITPPDQKTRVERLVAIGTTAVGRSLDHLTMAGKDDTFAALLASSRIGWIRHAAVAPAEDQWTATRLTLFVRGVKS